MLLASSFGGGVERRWETCHILSMDFSADHMFHLVAVRGRTLHDDVMVNCARIGFKP
mgnify:CR=1 FL=1